MSKIWKDLGLTAIIGPMWPHVTPRIVDMDDQQPNMIEYTCLQNLNGFPAGVMPVTEVLEGEE